MLRLAADENVKAAIVTGIRRSPLKVDILTVSDVHRRGEPDPVILDWAASEQRILITHDTSTMTASAYEKVRSGESMPGLLVVPSVFPVGRAVEEIVLFATVSREGEWEGQVLYLPLR